VLFCHEEPVIYVGYTFNKFIVLIGEVQNTEIGMGAVEQMTQLKMPPAYAVIYRDRFTELSVFLSAQIAFCMC
jgi:hypothetical protein